MLRRDLRAITLDGVFFSIMVGLGETYLPAFALAAGFDAVVAGLIATLPMLAGALFQLVAPRGARALRSYRRWVVLCAVLQALSFAPLVAGAIDGRIGVAWLFASATAYWAFGMATSPPWNAWMTAIVPRAIRARFFARRTRAAQAALLVSVLAGGLVLHAGSEREVLALFAAMFAAAALGRLTSALFLSRQSEPPGRAAQHRTLGPRGVLAAVRDAGAGRLLLYLLGMHAAVNLASPYFTPYMLEPLGLTYAGFMVLTGAALLARVLVLPLMGRIAQRHGTRRLLWLGALGIVPLPALWLVSESLPYLLGLQLVAGVAWAALELAVLLSFFERIDERDRASVLALFNLASAAAMVLGALVGGEILARVGGSPVGYALLFAISTLARLAVLPVLRGARSARARAPLQLRTLAVRPSAGSLDRPILATLEENDGTPTGDAPGGLARPPSPP